VVESAAIQPTFCHFLLKMQFCRPAFLEDESRDKILFEFYAPEAQYGARPVVISGFENRP
jgi:hypothetical protein